MTKAERIFKDTYTDCRLYVNNLVGNEWWQKEKVGGFNRLSYGDNESVSIRTINAIEKFIPGERKNIGFELLYGIIDKERAELLNKALDMVEDTIKNQRESLKA